MNQTGEAFVVRNSKLNILIKTLGTLLTIWVFAGNRIYDIPIPLWITGLVIVTLIILITVFWFLDWKTRSLTLSDDELLFCRGILNKRKLTIHYTNVSTVDLSRPLLYRFLFLTQLKVDCNSVGVGANLSSDISLAISKKSAEHIQKLILNKIHGEQDIVTDRYNGDVLYRADTAKLIYKSVLSMLSVIMLFLVFIVVPVIALNLNIIEQLVGYLLCIIFLAIIIGMSTVSIILSYGGMVLLKDNDRIRISYGMLDKKNVSIPVNKINGVILTQNILQRMFGFYNMRILSSGYGDEKGEEMSYIALSLKKNEAEYIKDAIIGAENTESTSVKPGPKMAALYHLPSVVILIVELLLVPFLFSVDNRLGVLLLAISIVLFLLVLLACTLNYIHSRMSFQERYFIVNKGGIYAQTVYLKRERCQAITYHQGVIQRIFRGGKLIIHLFGFMGKNTIDISNIDKIVLCEFKY